MFADGSSEGTFSQLSDLPSKLTCEAGRRRRPSQVGYQPIIADSARKHGVCDEDILRAYRNPIRVFEVDEGFTMVIGANYAAVIFEIGAVDGVQTPVIVHAMRAREKFVR